MSTPAQGSMVLVATIPTARGDGSPLAATDITSITYQKVPAGSPPGTAPTTLQTNSEAAGVGLSPSDLTFTDATANIGDSYTAFVTDGEGVAGTPSAPVVASDLSPPAAPGLTGTFTAA